MAEGQGVTHGVLGVVVLLGAEASPSPSEKTRVIHGVTGEVTPSESERVRMKAAVSSRCVNEHRFRYLFRLQERQHIQQSLSLASVPAESPVGPSPKIADDHLPLSMLFGICPPPPPPVFSLLSAF